MSDIKSEILFANAGLDTDRDYRYVDNGDAPYRLNILMAEDGSNGVITNLRGNRKVTYTPPEGHPWLRANAYFVLGSCYDHLTRNVYYWIFSQPVDTTGSGDFEYDNRLLRFNEDTELIDTIFVDPLNYFGLNPLYSLRDPFVIGDWLFFNPRSSEPKMIHIDMAYNYTNYDPYDETSLYYYGNVVTYLGGLFMATQNIAAGETPVTDEDKWLKTDNCYQNETDLDFDSEFRYAFNVIKQIPVNRPVCLYASDLDKHANNVRAKIFRFTHRYKYFDNSYSRYGAFSDITLPIHDEYYNGEITSELDLYNCIDVTVPLHSAALIKEVDIVFQETGGDWKRAKIINRQDIVLRNQISYTYRFYNTDSAYEPIDDSYFSQSYDAVPQKTNCQELINKNILCYGGVTEGFDNLDKNLIDVTLTPWIEAIDIPNTVLSTRRDCVAQGDISYAWADGVAYETYIDITSWYPNGMATDDLFVINIDGDKTIYTIQAADVAGDVNTFCDAIVVFLLASYPTMDWENRFGTLAVTGTPPLIPECVFYEPSADPEEALTKKRGFKTGAWHPFCIYYYDSALRRFDAQTSKEIADAAGLTMEGTTVYVPMLGEYSPAPLTTAYKWNIDWTINHLPPAEAKFWRWGYAGNALCSYFVQYIVSGIAFDNPWVAIDITPLQTLKTTEEAGWHQYPQSVIDPYSWQRGDRVRIITEESAGGDIGPIVDAVYDFEILKPSEDGNTIYTQNFDFAGISAGEDTIVEIYRPIKTDTSRVFFEFGEIMPIIEDSGGVFVHGVGNTGTTDQDYTLTQVASGTFKSGDVYHILRTPSKPINGLTSYFHESQSYSDFYDSDDWDKGRIGIETSFGQRYLNIVRHSNQYLQNTLINGLSTFDGDDYKELNDVYGDIIRIIEIGDTLKVYQRKKPSSILIGRTEYVDAEGNANIVQTSQRILGAIRYSSTNYGTEYPESISRNNRYVYGFDPYQGVMWRDSANGIFPISGRYETAEGSGDYRMETYFKAKSKALLVSGISHTSVLTVWDEKFKNLYVIFKDSVEEVNDDVVMFHEPSNRWICFTEMDQTLAEGWDQILELDYWILWGFEGGLGYSFDEDTRFAVFNIGSGEGTTPNTRSFPATTNLGMTSYDPTVQFSSGYSPDYSALTFTSLAPTILITYLRANTTTFVWAGSEYGDTYAGSATFDVPAGVATMTVKSSWLTVENSVGSVLAVGDHVNDGETITLYPNSQNFWATRNGTLTFTDSYGNSLNFSVTQLSDIGSMTVTFVDEGGYGISNELYSCSVGSDQLYISFDHSSTINSWVLIGVTDGGDNVLYVGTGYPNGIWLLTGQPAEKTMTLSRNLVLGDSITIQIG